MDRFLRLSNGAFNPKYIRQISCDDKRCVIVMTEHHVLNSSLIYDKEQSPEDYRQLCISVGFSNSDNKKTN